MEFGAIGAKKRISCPNSLSSENSISGSQGRCTLGSCMEATQSFLSFYPNWFGSKAQENHCQHCGPWSTQKVGKMGKSPYWVIYPMGHQSPYDLAYTYYGSSPPLDPESIMHAYVHVCKRQNYGACS